MNAAKKPTRELSIEQGLELIKSGQPPRYLPVEWSWHSERGNGGVSFGFVKADSLEHHRRDAGWTVSTSEQLVGFSQSSVGSEIHTKYSYTLVDGDAWPLVIRRAFYGLAEDQLDLLEEFRLFHNLWHDRSTDNYFRITHEAEKEKVVFRGEDGVLYADTAMMRKYASARDLHLMLQVDVVEFFDQPVEEMSRDAISDSFVYSLHRTNKPDFIDRPAFGRLVGKRFIAPLPVNQCGVWPFEPKKNYCDFMIGVDESGAPIMCTSNPEDLADYFGKNKGMPHYLTPVHFRKDVLSKYRGRPSVFSIEDGYLRCGGMWGLRMDNDHEDRVVVFLGDLGRDLSESEQLYWKSFNLPPDGFVSETCFRRAFNGEFAEPKNQDLIILRLRDQAIEETTSVFGFPLYRTLHEADKGLETHVRMPISDEWAEFDQCLAATTKLFIDYLNENALGCRADAELKPLLKKDPNRVIKGIDKLYAWLRTLGDDSILGTEKAIRTIQLFRSRSSAHGKGSSFDQLLKELGVEDQSPRVIFGKFVLAPLVNFNKEIVRIARNKSGAVDL